MFENKGLSEHIKAYINQENSEPDSGKSKTYIPQRMKVARKIQQKEPNG